MPLLACMFLANNVVLSFWLDPKQSSWRFILLEMKEQDWLVSSPHPSQFAQICEPLREEAWLHVSRALSIRVTGSGAPVLSCVTGDAGLLRTKARGSGALWLTACSFWRVHCDFWQRKEGIRTKQGKEEFVYFFPPAKSLVPVAKNITLIYKTNTNLIIYHLKFNSE